MRLLSNFCSETFFALREAGRELGHDIRLLGDFTTRVALDAFAPEGAIVFIYGDPSGAEESIDLLCEIGIPVAVWHVDDPHYFRSPALHDRLLRTARKATLFYAHTRQLESEYARLGISLRYLPTAARWLSSLGGFQARPAERESPPLDYSFVGTLTPERAAFLDGLRVRLDGSLKAQVFEGIPLREALAVYGRTRVNLAFGSTTDSATERSWAVTERSFEVPLMGGFLLQDERKQLEELFRPGEVVTFSDVDDCARKIEYFLAHEAERRAIADRAEARVRAEHLVAHRLTEIAHELGELRSRRSLEVYAPEASGRPACLVYCERLDNESFCLSLIRELEAFYEVRACGPGWPSRDLSELPRDGARFYLELDAASGNFPRPTGLGELRLPKFAWLVDTHKKPLFHAAIAREMDLTFFAMKTWGHVLEGQTQWLPLHCDSVIFHPVEAPREFDIAFVGSQTWRADPIASIARRHGLRVHVGSTPGPREKSETAAIYARTRLIFNRHVTNDLNFRVFEAMACGRVLLTDAQWNGQYDLFEDGKHYVLYKDDRDLEAQVLRYVRNDAARSRIEREGAAHAAAHHSTRARAAQLRDAIESFLGVSHRAAGARPQTAAHEATPKKRRWLVVAGDEPATVAMRSYGERIAFALAERGDDVVIARERRCALPLPAPRAREPEVIELEAGPVPRPGTRTNCALARAGPLHAALARLVAARGRFDAIVGEGAFGALLAQPLAARLDVPFLLALETCEVARRENRLTREELYWAELEHWAVDRARATVVPSAEVARALAAHYRSDGALVLTPHVKARVPRREHASIARAVGIAGMSPVLFLASSVCDPVPKGCPDRTAVLVVAKDGLLLRSVDGEARVLAPVSPRGAALAALFLFGHTVVAARADDPRLAEARALGCSLMGPGAEKPCPAHDDLAGLYALLRGRSLEATRPEEEPELAVL
jgi:glycosyltransferase involved in cell wall biosynthesis